MRLWLQMKTSHTRFSLLVSLLLVTGACSDSAGGDSESGGGGSEPSEGSSLAAEAEAACFSQCDAQETEGCGIGLDGCKKMCEMLLLSFDDACLATAKSSFSCNVDNGEVCESTPEGSKCGSESAAYTACLQG